MLTLGSDARIRKALRVAGRKLTVRGSKPSSSQWGQEIARQTLTLERGWRGEHAASEADKPNGNCYPVKRRVALFVVKTPGSEGPVTAVCFSEYSLKSLGGQAPLNIVGSHPSSHLRPPPRTSPASSLQSESPSRVCIGLGRGEGGRRICVLQRREENR